MTGPQPEANEPTTGRTLTQQTSRGFSWMLVQTIGSKPVTLASQLLLAALLLNEQWGLVGMALSVSVWAELFQQAGLREILIRRQHQFEQWANAAFWMALTTGIIAGALLVLVAPLAAQFYNAPELTGLLHVLALSVAVGGLGIVPDARLQSQMRFRAVAAIMFTSGMGQAALSVVLALVLPPQFGAYSFVIPYAVAVTYRAAAAWSLAPIRVRLNPQFALWVSMIPDSARLFIGSVFLWITNMAGIIVLGRMHGAVGVDSFFFAFQIAVQVAVLESNLYQVLLPSLSRLQHEPQRLCAAFLRACRGIELVGAPVAIMMAALADPGLRAVFGDKWLGAIMPLQLLGIGVAMSMTNLSSVALMKATGRFTSFVALYAVWSVAYTGLAILGAKFIASGATGVALATMVFYCLLGPVNTMVAIAPLGGRWRDVLGAYAPPVFASLASFGLAAWAANQLPQFVGREWVRLGLTLFIGGPACMLLLCRLAPVTLAELLGQVQHVAGRSRFIMRAIGWMRSIAVAVNPRCRRIFMPDESDSTSRDSLP